MMRCSHVAWLLVVSALISGHATDVEAAFEFEVTPVTLTDTSTGEDYMVSGTLTTDCVNCSLTETSLLAYDISVLGAPPFSFNENNLGQSLILNNVQVTDSQIILPMPFVGGDALSLDAQEATATCDPCNQSLSFSPVGADMLVIYSHFDGADFDPFAIASVQVNSPDGVVIANVVPEPAAGVSLVCLAVMGCWLRRRQV